MRLVGFTGASSGTTEWQQAQLALLLVLLRTDGEDWFIHGLCTGADEEIAAIASKIGYRLEGRPGRPVGAPARSLIFSDREFDVPGGKTPELTRNGDIVRVCEILLCAPSGFEEIRRSGTWSAIRRARSWHRERIIVWPDGTKMTERAGNAELYDPAKRPAPGPRRVS
jgi:hypothetical protein